MIGSIAPRALMSVDGGVWEVGEWTPQHKGYNLYPSIGISLYTILK